MKMNRFLKKALITILVLAIFVIALKGLADVMYYNSMLGNEESLMESYEEKKAKCELLISVKNDCVEEGKGINMQEIPNTIKYEITNQSDGNIKFYYYIEPPIPSAPNAYYVKITFSKNYEIIDEVYGFELEEDFETYKQTQYRFDRIESYVYAGMLLGIFLACILLIYWTIVLVKTAKKNKKSSS